jgi:signal transduction histidine kinase
MKRFGLTRTEVLTALACGGLAFAFLVPEGPVAGALGIFIGLAVLPYRRQPELSGLAVAALTALCIPFEVYANIPGAGLASTVSTFALGRYAGRRGLVVVVLLTAASLAPNFLIGLPFAILIQWVTWKCGRILRDRDEEAARAAAEAEELAAVDPAELAAGVIAEERSRLAGEALAVVRRAVVAMRVASLHAGRDLDPRALSAVQAEGRTAVADLRRLLGLLRAEEAAGSEPAPGESTERNLRRLLRKPGPLVWLFVVLFLMEATFARIGAPDVAATVLIVPLFGALFIRRSHAALACAIAAVPWLLSIPLDTKPEVLFTGIAALGVLSWSAAADGRPRALLALGVLAAATIGVEGADLPENIPGYATLFALTAMGGHLLGRRAREGEAAEAEAARLKAEQQEATERAARAERLRLARELHDVASHAVGVMVLQAGAALALRERDPAAAREAVDTLQTAGVDALSELDALFGVLDAGAVGPPGLAAPAPEVDLAPAVEAMVERVRIASLDVTLDVAEGVAPRGDVAAVALRVVQEALTNTLRHAPGSRVTVRVTADGGELVVEVHDDGPGANGHEPGFGLAGLEERVRALGGAFDAAATRGGFAVTARLPLEAPEGREVTA